MGTTAINAFYLGNYADMDPIEGFENWTNELEFILYGHTVGSAATPAHTLDETLYFNDIDNDGTITEDDSFQRAETITYDGVTAELDSLTVFSVNITYTDGTTALAGMDVIQDVNGRVFLHQIPENVNLASQLSYAALTAKPIQSITLLVTAEDNYTDVYIPPQNENIDYVCFAGDTRIMTPHGERLVRDLKAGDEVTTLADGKTATLRWVGRRSLNDRELRANPKMFPILISAGALGNGLPLKDLRVSRQHRMLVSSPIVRRMFGTDSVLVAANKLTALPGIFVDDQAKSVEYVHLLFDCHEIVLANGAPSESLYTGPEALRMLSEEVRDEILEIFPELARMDYAPEPIFTIPSGAEQRKLIERHANNMRPVLTGRLR